MNEEAIFAEAIDKGTPKARATYLDQACGGDSGLRKRVEALLAAHDHPDSFLNEPASDAAETIDPSPVTERAGAIIGPYKLREQLGEGGMGVVFVAEQEYPVRRKVALKIIKPGMDTKEVVARFEAERQALALMDHPNIAKVLDAGSTESGGPYFVMELVRGIPITEYCDQAKLTVRERLALFVQVCQAIQHAHQKGIIHRDVKPSNVLVTLHDSKPVPKVIDFGVAKATNQRLTERTIYTRFAQIIGTPMYMSPEQAALSGLDVDTRSDIYSLGMLLYELLTGTTPFDKERFDKAAYDEIRRIVREEQPTKPSTKISTLGDNATEVSAHRRTDPHSLSRFVQGDLDVIVMKAIEKDRTRRYDTASGLATDIERFLHNEPIVARPPSLVYRFGKFAQRNRMAVATSTVVLTSLLVAVIATSWSAHRAHETLRRLADAFYREAVAAALAGDLRTARLVLDDASNAGCSPYQIAVLNGLIALNEGDYHGAITFAEEAIATARSVRDAQGVAASALLTAATYLSGDDDRWERSVVDLKSLTPQTETDHLLKASVVVLWDPAEALSLLDEGTRMGSSPAGLFIRANARFLTATDNQDAKMMGQAARDYEYVQYFHRDLPSPLSWGTQAMAVAIDIAKVQQRPDEVERYKEQGQPLAEELRLITAAKAYPPGDYSRWLFYRACGDQDAASSAIRRVGRMPGSYGLFLAADCIQRYDVAKAAQEFDTATRHADKASSSYERLARAHVLSGLPDGAQRVRDLVEKVLDDNPPGLTLRHALSAFCLVASPAEIQQRAGKAFKVIAEEANISGGLYGDAACVTYLAGKIEESEFLERASKHGYAKANAHYTIGMLRLAAGERQEAYNHFTQCVATNTVGSFDYELAKAYLARMDAEPAWPHWRPGSLGK